MDEGQKVELLANVNDDRRTEGYAIVHFFSHAERMQQSLKKLGLFWGLAVLCIFIPVFHFVLVPLFLGLGVYFALRSRKSEGSIIRGETSCPHCGTVVHLGPSELQWPVIEICQSCARPVRMERK